MVPLLIRQDGVGVAFPAGAAGPVTPTALVSHRCRGCSIGVPPMLLLISFSREKDLAALLHYTRTKPSSRESRGESAPRIFAFLLAGRLT